MEPQFETVAGGVTAPSGFQAAGAFVGLRRKRKDLAIVKSDELCDFAAVFSTSSAKGAPIVWNQQVVAADQKVGAVVINSGNANSCTGKAGILHAEQMAETTAGCLGLAKHQVLVASTGVIGVPLQIDSVKAGIPIVAGLLDSGFESGTLAAEAIMTTDSFVKEMAVKFVIDGKVITLGAMAKGSGMLHPNMATMLAFLTTDLSITTPMLKKALKDTVDATYNMISVDADTSTNDMVAVLANGKAGNATIDCECDAYWQFVEVLKYVNECMAKAIASDGEGATKLLVVKVKGAGNLADARLLARAVVSSNLVKTAFHANDPNWGRVVAAMGASGVEFDATRLSLSIESENGSTSMLSEGEPMFIDERVCVAIMSAAEVDIVIELGDGDSEAAAWGCDLTSEYIRINGSYRSAHVVGFATTQEGVA